MRPQPFKLGSPFTPSILSLLCPISLQCLWSKAHQKIQRRGQVCVLLYYLVLPPISFMCPGASVRLARSPSPSDSEASTGSLVDRSGPLFSIYSEIASEEDKKMAERWQKDADGTLIFVSLRPNSVQTHAFIGL
jgi:hypothetical protein